MEPRHEYFNGIKYRRNEKGYYFPSGWHRKNGLKLQALHQEVWKAANGPIPKGHHIHHIDHDKDNNDLSNLECLTAKEHIAKHGRGSTPAKVANLARIRPLASAWHRSEEGRAWHRDHARKAGFGKKTFGEGKCSQCDASMTMKKANQSFCSNACKSAWRRKAGLDNEERTCLYCGSVFEANKYSSKKHCSRKCGSQSAKAKKRGR